MTHTTYSRPPLSPLTGRELLDRLQDATRHSYILYANAADRAPRRQDQPWAQHHDAVRAAAGGPYEAEVRLLIALRDALATRLGER